MDWVKDFYATTDRWWGVAESTTTPMDRLRTHIVGAHAAPKAKVLELGCGYGTTAALCAQSGHTVTAIDVSDRIDRAPAGDVTFVKEDFYTYQFDGRFDVVTYWDGFGVGSDDDQLRLLRRIGNDWLERNGVAIIEIFDPIGWARDHGLIETMIAAPELGYEHSLHHRREFNDVSRRALDIWSEAGSDIEWCQSLRCYSSDEFAALVSSSPLALAEILAEPRSDWSYIAVLAHR